MAPHRYAQPPHDSKYVMTMAEYLNYQREMENGTTVERLAYIKLLLQHAEIINIWEPLQQTLRPSYGYPTNQKYS